MKYEDLSKAYDRVSVPGLIYKLSQTGFSQAALQWFSLFLSSRRQCVQVNGSCSSWGTVMSGIPQGTVLGPTLFLLLNFTNDLPQCLVNECALFANDTSAYGVGKDSSQLHVLNTFLGYESSIQLGKNVGDAFQC